MESKIDNGDSLNVKDIYKEQYAHFRSMNDILYKIPPLFSVAIGGLWYFAASQLRYDKFISVIVFTFAAVLSICFINIMDRFGTAFNSYLDNLNKFDGIHRVTIKPSSRPSAVKTIKFILWACALVSILGAVYAVFGIPGTTTGTASVPKT